MGLYFNLKPRGEVPLTKMELNELLLGEGLEVNLPYPDEFMVSGGTIAVKSDKDIKVPCYALVRLSWVCEGCDLISLMELAERLGLDVYFDSTQLDARHLDKLLKDKPVPCTITEVLSAFLKRPISHPLFS